MRFHSNHSLQYPPSARSIKAWYTKCTALGTKAALGRVPDCLLDFLSLSTNVRIGVDKGVAAQDNLGIQRLRRWSDSENEKYRNGIEFSPMDNLCQSNTRQHQSTCLELVAHSAINVQKGPSSLSLFSITNPIRPMRRTRSHMKKHKTHRPYPETLIFLAHFSHFGIPSKRKVCTAITNDQRAEEISPEFMNIPCTLQATPAATKPLST